MMIANNWVHHSQTIYWETGSCQGLHGLQAPQTKNRCIFTEFGCIQHNICNCDHAYTSLVAVCPINFLLLWKSWFHSQYKWEVSKYLVCAVTLVPVAAISWVCMHWTLFTQRQVEVHDTFPQSRINAVLILATANSAIIL